MPAKFQPDRIIGSRDMGVREVAPDYGTQIPQRIRCTMLCNHDKKKYHLPSLDLWCRHFFHKLKTTPTIFFIFCTNIIKYAHAARAYHFLREKE